LEYRCSLKEEKSMFRHWHRFTHLLSTIILFAVALLPLGAPQAVQAAVQPALVKDIAAGAASSEPRILAEINGLVLFEAFDATNGWQLWSSDGTAAGTILLTDLSSENESISFNITRRIAEYAGSFYFMSGGPTKRKLWRSDGTVAGTRQVGTVQPRGPDGLNRPIQGIVFQNKLYFITQSLPSQEYSSTLWVTDGTDAGTTPINYPGSDADVLYDMVVAGNKLFFSVFDKSWEDEDGSERMTLYSTDGTAAGTVVLRSGENANIGNMTALNNKLLFNSYDPATGQELWSSDGTVAGTGIVKETSAGSFGSVSELVKLGSLVLFTTNPSPAKNLWRSDGTAAGTYRIKEFTSSVSGGWSLPNGAVGPGNYFYFFANDGQVGSELWRSDGSAAGTTLVKDTVPGPANSQAGSIFANNGSTLLVVMLPTSRVFGVAMARLQEPTLSKKILLALVNLQRLAMASPLRSRPAWAGNSGIARVQPQAPSHWLTR
jgi:ELWxxDGT repeat protein